MLKSLIVFIFVFSVTDSQIVNNVRLVGHIDYITRVLQHLIFEVEDREWCNLRVPDITVQVNEAVLGHDVKGKVTFFNGFVTSIQRVDIVQSSVQQVWRFNLTGDNSTSVECRATLRLHDVSLGYDVKAEMEDGVHRYTAIYRHPMVNFMFNMSYNIHHEKHTVEVVGQVPASSTQFRFMPHDHTTDVLTSMFNSALTAPGMLPWGPSIFKPITEDIIHNKVEYPRICYDCPVTMT